MSAAKVARVKRRDYMKAPLPMTTWRSTLKAFARWVALGLMGWLIFGTLVVLWVQA